MQSGISKTKEEKKNENDHFNIHRRDLRGQRRAQDKPTLTGVDSLAARPSDYAGKIVAVSGVVERVSETRRMFTLIDTSEVGCADGCQRAMIVAQLGQGVTTLPKATEPVVAIGEVDASAPSVWVSVTELISGKEAVDARLKQLSAQ
jgi:hypothetical protein